MSQNASAQGLEIRRQLERLARAQGLPLDRLIQDFARERFLYRLSRSPWVDRFVVKGAAMAFTGPDRHLPVGAGCRGTRWRRRAGVSIVHRFDTSCLNYFARELVHVVAADWIAWRSVETVEGLAFRRLVSMR